MNLIKNAITIIVEIVTLVLAILWYNLNHEYEPLILIISTIVALGFTLVFPESLRPIIELHKRSTFRSKFAEGPTPNNPDIIWVGTDRLEQYWRLKWNYNLELRNNSSLDAYSIEVIYENLPPKTNIEGSIGKIEAFLAHDERNFTVTLFQVVVGDGAEANKYLAENAELLSKDVKIIVKYKNEKRVSFRTKYKWITDKNTFHDLKKTITGTFLLCIIIGCGGTWLIKNQNVGTITQQVNGKTPIIDIHITPLILSLDQRIDPECSFHIETSNGDYIINKNIAIDSFKIERQEYFYDTFTKPSIIIKDLELEKTVLSSKLPEINGRIRFHNNFILAGSIIGGLNLGDSLRLASFRLNFPYEFEGKKLQFPIEVPIIIQRKQEKKATKF